MAIYSATEALQQALNETPAKRIGKKFLDNFDVDFSILGEVNPMDTKPASAFTEASRSWNNTPPSIIVSQSNPHSRARSSKKPIATAFRDTPNLIPSRQVETVATPPQTKDMVTPTQVLASALEATQPSASRFVAPPRFLPPDTPVELVEESLSIPASRFTTPSRFLPADSPVVSELGASQTPTSNFVPPSRFLSPDSPAVLELGAGSYQPPVTSQGYYSTQDLVDGVALGNKDVIAYLEANPGAKKHYELTKARMDAAAAADQTKTKPSTSSKSKFVAPPRFLPPDSPENIPSAGTPFYQDLRYQLGIGVPVAGLGAYGAYQMMQPAQEEVVYEAPAYGQMPRSFQG